MKKILFASTALVAASMMHAGAAEAAEKIKLNVGGYSKWWVVGTWQSEDFQRASLATAFSTTSLVAGTNGSGQRANVDIKGDNEIWFSGSTKLDNGLGVGVMIELEAGGHSDMSTDVIDNSYVWLEGGFGKVLAGIHPNGTVLTHVAAPDAANGTVTGSVLGVNFGPAKPTSVLGMNQIVGWSGSSNGTAFTADDSAEKITYVAPSFYGLTLGASYIPNVTRNNSRATPLSRAAGYGGAALYANTFGPVGVKASAGYVYVDLSAAGTAAAVDNFQATTFGGQVSYAGFTLGGSMQLAKQGNKDSYQNVLLTNSVACSQSATQTACGVNVAGVKGGGGLDFGGQAWDASLMYASGPYAVSVGYYRSQVEGLITNPSKDTIELYQASGKYNLSPGVDVLATVGYIEYTDERKGMYTGSLTSANDGLSNSGWSAMTGLSLAF